MSNIPPIDDFKQPSLGLVDPAGQPGLTLEIESGEIPIAYINRYIAETEVACAFCNQRQPHKKGFTAKMADGRIALCGIDCGRRYFGDHAARRLEQDLEAAEQAASEAELLARITEGIPLTLERMKKWTALEAEINKLLRTIPDVSFHRARANLDKGTDYVFFKQEKVGRTMPDGNVRMVDVETEICRVKEARVLWDTRGHLTKAQAIGFDIIRGLNVKGMKATHQQQLDMREDFIRTLREGIVSFEQARKFLEAENLKLFCRMYRDIGRSEIKVEAKSKNSGMFFRVRRDGEWTQVMIPEVHECPSQEELLGPLRLDRS